MDKIVTKDQSKSEIQEFFKDTNVFLTGGTGNVGSILLEKILRSCPVRNVYLMIREKKNKSPETRIGELFATPLFDRLRKEQPEFKKKIVLFLGDCEKPNLGMSEEDQTTLVKHINIVIHCAATVNFNESLKRSTFINVRSTRDLLIVANRIEALKAFVYISTAFSNCNLNHIKETVIESHMKGDTLIQMAETLPDSFLDSITNKCIGTLPNTYTFTKSVAENIIEQYKGNIPVCITRPAIVIGTLKEPVPGYIDNIFGANGLSTGVGIGAIRVLLAKSDMRLTIIPSDTVANLIITSAWYTGVTSKTNPTPVFNYVSNNMAPDIRLNTIFGNIVSVMRKKQLFPVQQVWYPGITYTTSKTIFTILFVLLHFIPAILADIYLRLFNYKFRAFRIYKKVYKLIMVLSPFMLKEIVFEDDNLMSLISCQTNYDKLLFNMDLRNLQWTQYIENNVRGSIRYFFKCSGKPDIGVWRRTFLLHYGMISVMTIIMLYFFRFLLGLIL